MNFRTAVTERFNLNSERPICAARDQKHDSSYEKMITEACEKKMAAIVVPFVAWAKSTN